ncbi:protein kinase domain-containing protein [Liquorilactobacillus hordei]|uniref:Serine threonine protein kinase n=1 Tax=Liquorilactobacillus hordei DSM 19519 TaxID=1423759 RepID=A0A0R1M6Y7_9LACO|nr:protein kinase [Liquorilactobacillus hordei]KRL03904.1 serine threonine protein kinase [Liquorilactobacillus hordei DSM 19519]QYH53022.1 protein kinase [Liquorilactobacillus hordei DSM 19519]
MKFLSSHIIAMNSLELKHYKITHNSSWLYFKHRNKHLDNQGWKIHISSTLKNLSNIIQIVVPILLEHKLSFKIPVTEYAAKVILFGGAGYLENGKVITIYVGDKKASDLESIIYVLASACDEFSHDGFPNIITDLQFEKTCIFLRYGGITPVIKYDKTSNPHQYLIDYEDHLVEDIRRIGYFKPNWVQLPFFLSNSIDKLKLQKEKENLLSDYDLHEPTVITRRTKSSVYQLKYNNKLVILKQASRFSVQDELKRDSIYRLKNELHILKLLKDCNVPKIIAFNQNEREAFLIEEKIDGMPLVAFFKQKNYVANNYTNITKIIINLQNEIKKIHNHGIIIRDLSEQNILVDKNLNVYLIDFEIASIENEKLPISGFTVGKSLIDWKHVNNRRTSKEDDYFAFGSIIFFITTSFNTGFNEATHNYSLSDYFQKLNNIALSSCKGNYLNLALLAVKIMQKKQLPSIDEFHKFPTKLQLTIDDKLLAKKKKNLAHRYLYFKLTSLIITDRNDVFNSIGILKTAKFYMQKTNDFTIYDCSYVNKWHIFF